MPEFFFTETDNNQSPEPELQHPSLKALANFGLAIPAENLDEILSLPRATLIQSLEATIRQEMERPIDRDFHDDDFLLFNCLLLLGHLQSAESLPLILEVLRLDDEKMNFFFGDYLFENFWQVPMLCGENQIETLKDFVKADDVPFVYSQTTVIVSIEHLAHWIPELKPEVVDCITQLLQYFDDLDADADIDPYLVASIANSAANLQIDHCLPIIESLFQKGMMDTLLRGNWKEFQRLWNQPYRAKQDLHRDVRTWYQEEGVARATRLQEQEEEQLQQAEERIKQQRVKEKKATVQILKEKHQS